MKKRNRKSKKNIESRIAQITALAYRVTKQGNHDVCVRYSSICNLLEVDIFIDGYKNKFPGDYNWGVYGFKSKGFNTLSQIRAKLNSLLKENSR